MSTPLINEIRTQAILTIVQALNGLHVQGDLSSGPRGNITQVVPDTVVQRFHFTDHTDGVKYEYTTHVHVSVSRRPV